MYKLLAIIRREYWQRVRTRSFVISTILGPVLTFGLLAVPVLLVFLNTGETPRLAVVDQTGKMAERVRESIMRPPESALTTAPGQRSAGRVLNVNTGEEMKNGGGVAQGLYRVEQVAIEGRSLEDVRRELNERILRGDLDGYLILPLDVLSSGKVQYYGRNVGDVVTMGQLEDRLNRALLEQRMAEASIDPALVREMAEPVAMSTSRISERGEEADSGGAFFLVVAIGILIVFTISMYGSMIQVAVNEEKQTRIVEILLGSVRASTLMMGKLLGVSLVAITQYAIWALAFVAFKLLGTASFIERELDAPLPHIPFSVFVALFLFFLLGYFVYATIHIVDGSIGGEQQGGRISSIITLLQVAGYFLIFPVLRSPGSRFSFWASMIPFFSPVLMPVRIVSQTPPFWQIILSLLIGLVTVVLLIWLAARIYRTGMLMYGQRASIAEVMRWVRQPER